jgi:hypothetical protein
MERPQAPSFQVVSGEPARNPEGLTCLFQVNQESIMTCFKMGPNRTSQSNQDRAGFEWIGNVLTLRGRRLPTCHDMASPSCARIFTETVRIGEARTFRGEREHTCASTRIESREIHLDSARLSMFGKDVRLDGDLIRLG